ncbi:MAG: response regulator [Candidatus Latescibacterota bacterium]|nr:MAG: response regulator [Candidatus Latescibacterota bacterium]
MEGTALILVAEDSPTVRKLVTLALKAQGFRVVQAQDGMDALEKLARYEVDLIITDLNMPNMDGYSLIQAIRENEHLKDVPIIVLSLEAKEEDKQRAFALGADSYLVKPFNARRVQFEVAKFIN